MSKVEHLKHYMKILEICERVLAREESIAK